MVHPIDIFEVEGSAVRWIAAAPTVEEAKRRIKDLAPKSPTKFIVLDQRTGNKVFIENAEELGPMEA